MVRRGTVLGGNQLNFRVKSSLPVGDSRITLCGQNPIYEVFGGGGGGGGGGAALDVIDKGGTRGDGLTDGEIAVGDPQPT